MPFYSDLPPCGIKGTISCRNEVKTVDYAGLVLHFVRELDYEGCVVNDLDRNVFILNAYWQRLTEEEKRGLLDHELTELELFKQHGDLVGAHMEAMRRENPQVRAKRLNICREVRRGAV